MEGKAVLFKKFAGIDVFDIEVAETIVDKLVDIIVALEPTFGGINLEDIKGPECFEVEEKAKARMGIPVFHDDQHGTAIIVSAAVVNALELTGKKIGEVKIVCSGAGRGGARFAQSSRLARREAREHHRLRHRRRRLQGPRDTDGSLEGGLCAGNQRAHARRRHSRRRHFPRPLGRRVLKPEMLKQMANDPLVMALANPTPEIMPELALETRPDAMICTGRSDYPNQVNNVLCFPYMFRGALDVGASEINEAMKKAAVAAIAALARETPSEVAAQAYGGQSTLFGKTSLIPSPFDPRLMLRIAPAVARAAMESGVARRPIADFDAYADQLNRFVFRSGFIMKPLFAKARAAMKTRHLFRRRGRAGAAGDAGGAGGAARQADPDRPSGGDQGPHQALRPDDPSERRFRNHRSARRSALSRLCRDLPQGGGAKGRDAGRRAHRRPVVAKRDRGARASIAAKPTR